MSLGSCRLLYNGRVVIYIHVYIHSFNFEVVYHAVFSVITSDLVFHISFQWYNQQMHNFNHSAR